MRKQKCTIHGRFNILYILVVSSGGRCIADKLRTRLFRSTTGDRLPRSERYDYVRLFAEFDSFAAADSDSWTSRVMSSSFDSILHALDWSISREFRACERRTIVSKIQSSVTLQRLPRSLRCSLFFWSSKHHVVSFN